MRKIIVIIASLSMFVLPQTIYALDASSLGTVYGDAGGLARVASLETQLKNMSIKSGHPRIILTPELIATARQRVAANHYKWASIKSSANAGNLINAAFVYQIFKDSDPVTAKEYATKVFDIISNAVAVTWTPGYSSNTKGLDRNVALWAIAFDWVYEGLTDDQRKNLLNKIGNTSNIAGFASLIRSGSIFAGETFHREEWIFYAWKAWPELALAGHYTDADFCYKSRWSQNWFYGDAARAYAYLNDGTPLEGYQYGADGTSWFMALKSATGINLVDGDEFRYDVSAADYQLYSMDFGLNRNVFHHGVGLGAGGLCTYSDTTGTEFNWKLKEYHSMATQLVASRNPYQQWLAKNVLTFDKRGASSWIFSNEYYNGISDFENISSLLFYDPAAAVADPRQATYDELPFAKHFPGGNEVYMRSSWGNDAAMACFRSTPAFTKTAHGDFDVNTFMLYRKGNLAPDSGVYDSYWGQTNYFAYQKNTVAHNDMLIIDPTKPDAPTKLSSSKPDPGGTELVSTRNFSGLNPAFPQIANTFLLNSKANWGDIVAFETQKDFDYVVGEAAGAYGSRVDEYYRSALFIRKPGDKAYFVVYDRVKATNSNFKKKWLLHTVGEPVFSNGSIINTEVSGHVYTTNGDSYSASNIFNNSALYGKVLLPREHLVRKVGGNGYEFWVDGSSPKNWPLSGIYNGTAYTWMDVATAPSIGKEWFMGGPLAGTGNELKEVGQWRLELMPATQQQRDLFLNVIYMGDTGESPAQVELVETVKGNMTGAYIKDSLKPMVVMFSTELNGKNVAVSIGDIISYNLPSPVSSSIQHLLVQLPENTDFTSLPAVTTSNYVAYNWKVGAFPDEGTVYRSSNQGVLWPSSSLSLFGSPPAVPAAPKNLAPKR